MKNFNFSKKTFVFLNLFLLSQLLFSCKTVTENSQNEEIKNNSKQINEQIIKPDKALQLKGLSDGANIKMKANVSFKFPEMSNSASTVIEIAKKDSILITISGFLGISVGKLYANPHEFLMNNNLQSTTFAGKPSEQNIMQIANIPLSFNDLVSILRTSPPAQMSNYKFNDKISTYFKDNDFTSQVIETLQTNISGENLLKLERKIGTTNILTVNFSQHFSVGNYRFAKKIDLDFHNLNGKIEIIFSEISIIDKPTNPMKFEKPKSYKLIEF